MTSTKMTNFLTNLCANPICIKEQQIHFFKKLESVVTNLKTTTPICVDIINVLSLIGTNFKEKKVRGEIGDFKC